MRLFLQIPWISILAVLILSCAGECVAPSSLSRLLSKHDPVRDTDGARSVSVNARLREDLENVDADAVEEYSAAYNVDFRLILAMIKQESRFDEDAVSSRGAEGLLQVMPITRSEIAEELYGQDPSLPDDNLRAGVYYVAKLCELFKDVKGDDKICLVLAAYNAGPSRVYDAQELAAYLGDNPKSWASIKTVLPLLSKRYYSLHQSVWDGGRPPNGCFGCSGQTIRYVDNIMNTYRIYRQAS